MSAQPEHALESELSTIAPAGRFTDAERDTMVDAFLAIGASPYQDYDSFKDSVWRTLTTGVIPEWFTELLHLRRERAWFDEPVTLLQNAPIDPVRPVFDYDEPVESKYQLKTTFVAEAFLEAVGQLSGTPAISYQNVNSGDVFQDIYPKRALAGGLSQKSTTTLPFHRDIFDANVPVDHIYMLGMRSPRPNKVYTTYVSNKAIVDELSDEERQIASEARFTSTFDDMKYSEDESVDYDTVHAVLSPNYRLHYFENRTRGVDPAADAVAMKIGQLAHALKAGVMVEEGDLVLCSNGYCLHSREVQPVVDQVAMQQRWILKTVNVDSLAVHAPWMSPDARHLVAGGWRP